MLGMGSGTFELAENSAYGSSELGTWRRGFVMRGRKHVCSAILESAEFLAGERGDEGEWPIFG